MSVLLPDTEIPSEMIYPHIVSLCNTPSQPDISLPAANACSNFSGHCPQATGSMLWPQSRAGSTWEFTCPLGGEEEGAGIYQRLKGTGWLKPSSLISHGATLSHNLFSRVLWDQLRPSWKRHIFPWLSPLLTLLFNIVSSFLCETTNSLHELLTILLGCASNETILTQPIRNHCFSNVRNPVIISSGFAVNIIIVAQI